MPGAPSGAQRQTRLATLDERGGESAWTEVADGGELMAHGIPSRLQG